MQVVSTASASQSYRLAPSQNSQSLTSHRKQHRQHDDNSVATATDTLSKLSNSVLDLRDQLSALSTNVALPDAVTANASVASSGAKIINKQQGVLQIHTQEGDVVTLRFKSKVSASFDSQQLQSGDTSASATNTNVRGYSRVELSVDGDLNDDELKAVQNLVGKVSDLTNDFFNGNVDDVLAKATSLSYDNSQLQDFSLSLRLKQSVSAYSYAALAQKPSDTATAAPSPSPAPVAVEPPTVVAPTVVTPVIIPPTAEASDAASQATSDTTTAVTDPVVEQPATSPTTVADTTQPATQPAAPVQADVAKGVTQVLADYVAKVRASFSATASDASLGFSYEFKMHLLISSIVQSAPADATPTAAGLTHLQQQLSGTAA